MRLRKWPALILIECSPWFPRNRLRLVELDYLLRFLAPCWTQTPPCTTILPHPPWLQNFTIAPCRTQTPPFTTLLSHPSWLQRFTLAPCWTQTPPCWTCLSHPSWLQPFTIAPCRTQTPPCMTLLSHPSWLQYLRLLAPLSLSCLTPRTHLA